MSEGGAGDARRGVPPAVTFPGWVRMPELEPLWQASFRALQRADRHLPRSIAVRGMSAETRREVGALVDRMLLDPDARVDAVALDAVLRRRCGAGLLTVVESVIGPVPDRSLLQAAREQRRRGPLSEAIRAAAAEGLDAKVGSWLMDWAQGVERAGMVVRHSLSADDLLRSLRAASSLVSGEPTSRVQLAARYFGDAHALDPGSARESLVLRAMAARFGQAPPRTAPERRHLWEQAGVLPDQLSSTCLLLGIQCAGNDDPVAGRLAMAATAGDPVHLTAWDLARLRAPFDSPVAVFVCENPRVLEAVAQRFGGRLPSVCVSGQPGLVTMSVLRKLSSAGTILRYHGDFDWPGIAITNRLLQSVGAQPWAMTATDYRDGAARTQLPITGDPVEPLWDPELGRAMRDAGRAVHQEVVLDQLLDRLVEP